jgi:predicted CXXCH cytochrome family protein
VTGNCASCHNGTTATGKHGTHIQTTNLCEDCHSTSIWAPVTRVDHAAVLGTCFSCHNGTTALGKTANHLASDNNCDDCHTTNGWVPAVFDHVNVAPGTCTTCHNGTTSTGKPSGHVSTSAQCDECHSTIAWLPASFNHDQVTGSCSSCHNGTTATGKPGGHFVTGLQCDVCHSTNVWIPIDFRHSSPTYPGDHRGNLLCTACHKANSEVVTWSAPAYKPDCAGCHANDFESGPHKKYENPDARYNVSELRDCSGSCHIYTDSSMTSIKESRPGPEHRVNGGDF